MEQKLAQLYTKLEADKSLGEKLFSLETPEEVQSLLKEQGIEFNLDEINMIKEALAKSIAKAGSGELSDEDLENVAGGVDPSLVIEGVVKIGELIIKGIDIAVRSRW